MKWTISLSLVFLLVSGCRKEIRQTCQTNDPLQELSWLREVKNSLGNCSCEKSIIQATYEGQTVFYVAMTDPVCDGIQDYVLLDCEGKVVRTFKYDHLEEFWKNIKIDAVLYRCKDK
jgi:hypothetical protein